MKLLYKFYYLLAAKGINFYSKLFENRRKSLRTILLQNNQNRWLDLGSSTSYNEGFYFCDLMPVYEMPSIMQEKYFQINITEALSQEKLSELGTFDFIRMQHVFEHFTLEDGKVVLDNCYKLLKENGFLLITVPDLKIFIKRYQRECLDKYWSFKDWAETRIPSNSPQSFYFSIFSHSVPYQSHLWCYDEKGLKFLLETYTEFKNIKKLTLFNALSSIPFTHNRPLEDLCILAQKV